MNGWGGMVGPRIKLIPPQPYLHKPMVNNGRRLFLLLFVPPSLFCPSFDTIEENERPREMIFFSLSSLLP